MRRARVLLPVVVATGLIVGMAGPAEAATTWFVSGGTACTDTGPGTAAAPFCTIRAAAAKAVAGDTVRVAAGTYREAVTVPRSGTAGAPIVYDAASGVTVTGGVNGFKLSGRSFVTIRGFTVRGTSGAGILVSNGTNVTLSGNDVSSAGQRASGLTAKGISLSGVTNSVVQDNVTHDNSDAGIGLSGGSNGNTVSGNESFGNARGFTRAAAGIDLRNSTGNQVSANLLHDNEDSGLNIWNGSVGTLAVNNVVWRNGDHGIDVHSTNDARVVANTVYRNVDSGIEMTGSLRTRLANNISADNGIASPRTSGQVRADAASAPSTTLDFDLLFLSVPTASKTVFVDWAGTKHRTLAAFTAATGQEQHGVSADPAFVNPPADLHLTAGSPAIGRADATAPGAPSTDADGAARTAPFDIGAYEFR